MYHSRLRFRFGDALANAFCSYIAFGFPTPPNFTDGYHWFFRLADLDHNLVRLSQADFVYVYEIEDGAASVAYADVGEDLHEDGLTF